MTPSSVRPLAFAALVASLPLQLSAQEVVSLFNTDADGWTAVDTPDPGPGIPPTILAVYAPTYEPTGSGSGFVQLADPTQGPTFYWRAPAKFLGDVSFAYGSFLRFSIRDDGDVSYFMFPDVILTGAGLTLEYSMNTLDYPIGPDFVSYSIPLTESAWSNVTGDGSAPTHAQMEAVLGDMDGLYIRGEYLNGPDVGALDSVSLIGDVIFANGFEY